jgi:hypothetical protein
MKVSARLTQSQIALLGHDQEVHKLESRSEALQQVQDWELEEAYRLAGEEWQGSGDAALWEKVSGDGQ